MKTFIVIGAPGSGKSPFIKEAIRGRRSWVFDVQNEYGQRTKYPGEKPLGLSLNPKDPQARFVPNQNTLSIKEDVMKFAQICTEKRDTNVVWEECTIYLEGRQQEAIKKLMVNKLHTGNFYYFVFHSIEAVPPRIMQMSDYCVLHKTGDNATNVASKYQRLFPYFMDMQDMAFGSRLIIKLM